MKRIFLLVQVLLTLTISVLPSDFILKEVNEPKTLNIAGDNMIISESESILIYSLKEKKLIRKFGKNGEGPGEFKLGHGAGNLKIDVIEGKLIVNSGGKLSWFTLKGDFIKEMKIPPMAYLIPVKNNFIGNTLSPSKNNFPSFAISLFDKNLKKTNLLFNSNIPVGMGAKVMVPPYNFIYRVFKEHIYLSTGKENIEILILDSSGMKTGKVKLDNSRIKIDEKFKNIVFDFYKNDPVYKNYWSYMKKHMFFPEFFPGLKDFKVENKLLYIQTYKLNNENFEWIIADLKGKILKRVYLPQNIESAVAYSPVTVSNGKYYYLVEDIDEENWSLHTLGLGL